jgi:conjugal transfer/type IV secretion protein DotA/TraY
MAMPFTPSQDDVSIDILRRIFGPIIDSLIGGADPDTVAATGNVLATMFQFFNSGLLVVAATIVSYVAVVGAINTANDGEAMGKNWSSVWTPLRIVTGAIVMLPSAAGYSFIQLIVMLLGLYGVGFADGLFEKGIEAGILQGSGTFANQSGYGAGAKKDVSYPMAGIRSFGGDYLKAAYCAKTLNNLYSSVGANVSAGNTPDRVEKSDGTGSNTVLVFDIKDRSATSNLAGGEALCGSVRIAQYTSTPANYSTTLPSFGKSISLDPNTIKNNQEAIESLRSTILSIRQTQVVNMMKQIDQWVATLPPSYDAPGWENVDSKQFNTIVNTAEQNLKQNLAAQMNGDTTVSTIMKKYVNDVTKDGWAMAGGWYQRIGGLREQMTKIYTSPVGTVSSPGTALGLLPSGAARDAATNSLEVADIILKKAGDHNNAVGATPVGQMTLDAGQIKATLPSGLDGLNADTFRSGADGFMSRTINDFTKGTVDILIGTNSDVDSIARIKQVGDWLYVINNYMGAIKMTAVTVVTGIRVAASFGSTGIQVLGTGVKLDLGPAAQALWDAITEIIIKPLASMSMWLQIGAFYFGVFLPSLPYTIFMIGVVGWVLAFLQSTIAAPLWAVMHMTPDRSFVGSQTQGYLLLLSLAVRPALMIIGLFGAMLAADPILEYLAKSFFATRYAITTSQESLGWIVEFAQFKDWLTVFGMTCLPVMYMIFGLSQALPDVVLRWIGAGISSMGETEATSSMRTGLQQNAAGQAASALTQKANQGGSKNHHAVSATSRGMHGGSHGGPVLMGGGSGPNGGGSGGGGSKQIMSANDQGVADVNRTNNASTGAGPTASSSMPATSGSRSPVGGSQNPPSSTRPVSTRIGEGLGTAIGFAAANAGSRASSVASAAKEAYRSAGGGYRGVVAGAGQGIVSSLKESGSLAAKSASEGSKAIGQGVAARTGVYRRATSITNSPVNAGEKAGLSNNPVQNNSITSKED